MPSSHSNKFEVTPLVVRVDSEAEIRVRPRFAHAAFPAEQELAVRYIRDDGVRADGTPATWNTFEPVPFTVEGGTLVIRCRFQGEHEHTFRIVVRSEGAEKPVGEFHLYSLEADLFNRSPFKGDIHMHSRCSDGLETPAYVAASARRVGLDFMALTDHRQYAPSLAAMEAMSKLSTDLRCYPGEEVHPPDSAVHIVNFGGSASVNELFASDPNYAAEVEALSSQWPELSLAHRQEVASSEWSFQKIRQVGGLAIYCHPYWKPNNRFNVSGPTNDALFKQRAFDAFEVIGGFYRHQMESNALAIARYHDENMSGQRLPVVGVSDAHGCDRDLFGWYYTIVLARSGELPDLIAAIRETNAVAVEAVPGEFPRVIGPGRLVKFVYFLLREFYPTHDSLCEQEGLLMLDHLAGDPMAQRHLADLQGQVPALTKRCWR